MSAPPPPGPISGTPTDASNAPICAIISRAAVLPLKPNVAGASTPESDSSANT